MKLRELIVCFALLALCVTHRAAGKPVAKRVRVYAEVPLSSREHDDSVDYGFDHEAFLGSEEAERFEHLTPEESRDRLGALVERIDRDQDGYVTVEEMKRWIKHVQNRWAYEDAERQRARHDLDGDGLVSWEEYLKSSDNTQYDPARLPRDERRFKMADRNADVKLDKEEFVAFLLPEQHDHMTDLLVQEVLEDLDKNGDGHVDLEEYVSDLFPHEAGDPAIRHEWLAGAKEHFTRFIDKNGDGKIDEVEIRDWILPDTDYAGTEARHLVDMSDADGDGRLTRAEIIENYNLFVGSMATDFGQALYHRHDEF